MKTKFLALLIALINILLVSCSSSYSWNHQIDQSWLKHKFWDRGKAEILLYQAKEKKYGIFRDAQITHVFVKEEHEPKKNVKAKNQRQKKIRTVLKFNSVRTIPTGIYTYREMATIFFTRESLDITKAVFSSQEWCGQTFKELVFDHGKISLQYDSYWNGEGKGKITFPKSKTRGAIPYNALPLLLRTLRPHLPRTQPITLIPNLISNRVGNPKLTQAKIHFLGKTSIKSQGIKREAFLVEVKQEKKQDQFWFSTQHLFPLLRWERHDGAVYELQKRLVTDYWNKNRPEDEKLLR